MIKWDAEDLKDPNNDLCVCINGVYLDVVQDYKGKWSAMRDCKLLASDLSTRKDAMNVLEKFFEERS